MTVLVTGCAGFIGWKVSELLLKEGHDVIGADNLNAGYDARLKEWRLSRLKVQPRFTFRRLNIVDPQPLAQVFQDVGIDAVINLAALAGVRQSIENPVDFFSTNLNGTVNLLEICRKEGTKKFIQASTSSVYGESDHPCQEDLPTDRPLSPYAASKKAAELACYAYHQSYGLDVTVLRYFTVYGPAGRPDMAIFRFIRQTAEGETLILYGDGSQTRDFTYVEDVARGTLAALEPMGFEVINLGSDRPWVLRDVLALIDHSLGMQAQVETTPRHPADPMSTWADISKAKRILGWQPQVPFEEGLCRAIDWYGDNRDWAKELR